MKALDNLIILLLIGGAFVAGLRLSARFYRQAYEQEQHALRKQFARLQAGIDADDSAQPYVAPPNPIPDSFVEHLRRNGAATIRVKPN